MTMTTQELRKRKVQLEADLKERIEKYIADFEQETGEPVYEAHFDYGRVFVSHAPTVEVVCFVARAE